MTSLVSCLISTFPLVSLSYSLSSGIYHIPLYIFSYLLLLLATNNSSSPNLSFSIFFYVLLLVYYSIIWLFTPSTLHPSIYILFLLLTPSSLLFISLQLLDSCFLHFLYYSNYFFIFSPSFFWFFLLYLLLVLLLPVLLSYKSICS